jgi:hypothetical protein
MSHLAQKCGNWLQSEKHTFPFENRGFLPIYRHGKARAWRAARGFAAIAVITVEKAVVPAA